MKLNRQEFLQRLDAVQPGLSPKELTEQSSCFGFRNGWVLTFNDEVACKAPSRLPKEFLGAVKAHHLLAQLREWTEDDIDVEWTDTFITIKGKGKKAKVPLVSEVLQRWDRVETPKEWYALSPEFSEAVGVVRHCAADDEKEGFITTCVNLCPDRVEAFDNNQLAVYRLDTGLPRAVVVRKEAIRHVLPLDMTEVADTENWVHFRNPAQVTMSCRKWFDEFEDLTSYPDFEGDHLVLPKGIADAARRAGVYSTENKDDPSVTVELRPASAKNPPLLKVTGRSDNGPEFEQYLAVAYAGPPFVFCIVPDLLQEIVKRHTECRITEDRLKVDGGKWVYVTSLGVAEESYNGNGTRQPATVGGDSGGA